MAIGDTASVKRGIDGVGGANITGNTELMNLIHDIDDSNAWAVGRFDALITHANLPEVLALARMQAGSKPEMQALVSTLQVSGTGRTVTLSFSLPSEAIEAIGAAAGAAHRSGEHQVHEREAR